MFAPGTLDYAYGKLSLVALGVLLITAGYDGIQGLSVNQRVNNADTYALYANGELLESLPAALTNAISYTPGLLNCLDSNWVGICHI